MSTGHRNSRQLRQIVALLQPFSGDVVADRESARTQVAHQVGKTETFAKDDFATLGSVPHGDWKAFGMTTG